MQAVPAAASQMGATKAGFWIRVLAFIIDSILIGIVESAVAAIFNLNQGGRSGLQILFGLVYFVYFWSNSSPWPGQTVGMKLLNLRVTRTDGSDLDLGQALIRYVGLFIALLVIFIGVIWVAFDPNKQGWQDKIAGTYVIKTS
jgi:uncharacterized RDD family membrane protein YckC